MVHAGLTLHFFFCVGQRESLMHNAVLSLDMNRASMVSISIPGLTEPHPYELILHPGVFLCLADKFTYDVVSTGLFHGHVSQALLALPP